jgi:hypothetical protein
MAAKVVGRTDWGMSRDADGHRNYYIDWRVRTDDPNDGPYRVAFATGLAAIGATWNFGNDNDPWAFCLPEFSIKPLNEGEKCEFWKVTQSFSTKPMKRCQSGSISDPLLEPYTLGGTFKKYAKTATKDRFGIPLTYSNFEPMKGELIRVEETHPTIEIGFNTATLPLATFSIETNCVNDSTLWGLPPRTIKFTDVTWSRKIYGVCFYYFTVHYSFEISISGWDVEILDEGRRVLKPGGDKNNPKDFEVYKDRKDENTSVLLDGNGSPLVDITSPVYLPKEILLGNNLLLLGIPAIL